MFFSVLLKSERMNIAPVKPFNRSLDEKQTATVLSRGARSQTFLMKNTKEAVRSYGFQESKTMLRARRVRADQGWLAGKRLRRGSACG
ncbi:hypothetical protein XELAEV_18046883mg [Xenopus laevis]|uniref:Uncharacterized protein n=1 Tax=Xenopus laevis TaxID=8355 RepID=A0A974BUH7_XENLA|nr:hypothetical protein XELAEV_18046883mg [Xenopus laevis]